MSRSRWERALALIEATVSREMLQEKLQRKSFASSVTSREISFDSVIPALVIAQHHGGRTRKAAIKLYPAAILTPSQTLMDRTSDPFPANWCLFATSQQPHIDDHQKHKNNIGQYSKHVFSPAGFGSLCGAVRKVP